MRTRPSFWASLGSEVFEEPSAMVLEIRRTMLDALACLADRDQYRHLESEISAAGDLATLWYQRPRLAQALNESMNQEEAGHIMHQISSLFSSHFGSAIEERFGRH